MSGQSYYRVTRASVAKKPKVDDNVLPLPTEAALIYQVRGLLIAVLRSCDCMLLND